MANCGHCNLLASLRFFPITKVTVYNSPTDWLVIFT